MNLAIRKTIREGLTDLKHHFLGNPANCELAERGPRERRMRFAISTLIGVPEITRFLIQVFS